MKNLLQFQYANIEIGEKSACSCLGSNVKNKLFHAIITIINNNERSRCYVQSTFGWSRCQFILEWKPSIVMPCMRQSVNWASRGQELVDELSREPGWSVVTEGSLSLRYCDNWLLNEGANENVILSEQVKNTLVSARWGGSHGTCNTLYVHQAGCKPLNCDRLGLIASSLNRWIHIITLLQAHWMDWILTIFFYSGAIGKTWILSTINTNIF